MSETAALRLGTRASLLARTQSQEVANAIEKCNPGLMVELVTISTTGDRTAEQSLAEAGGKGLFTRELEQALLDRRIDLAVHSFKDLPTTMPLVSQEELVVGAVPVRQDVRDVLICRTCTSLHDLPQGATIGSGSLRRKCQILQVRPDLQIIPMRGNVDTRLKKLESGLCDAIILAMAGLKRLNLFDMEWMHPIEPEIMLPSAGQGALALQIRRDNSRAAANIAALNDPATASAVIAERAVVMGLNGDCHSPIGALATLNQSNLTLRGIVGSADGNPPVRRAEASCPLQNWQKAVDEVCRRLRAG